MTDVDHFGDIRSLLHRAAPGGDGWEELKMRLEEWDPPADIAASRVIPYIEAHLSEWPAQVRALEVGTMFGLRKARRAAWLPLVRAVALVRAEVEVIREVAGASFLNAVEVLDLSGNALNDDDLATWLETQRAEALRELVLDNNELTSACIRPLERSGLLPQLERLSLRGNNLSARGVDRVESYVTNYHNLDVDVRDNASDIRDAELRWRDWEEATELAEWEKWSEWERGGEELRDLEDDFDF